MKKEAGLQQITLGLSAVVVSMQDDDPQVLIVRETSMRAIVACAFSSGVWA